MKSKFLLTLLSGIITLSALAQKPVILRFEPKTGTKGTKSLHFWQKSGFDKICLLQELFLQERFR